MYRNHIFMCIYIEASCIYSSSGGMVYRWFFLMLWLRGSNSDTGGGWGRSCWSVGLLIGDAIHSWKWIMSIWRKTRTWDRRKNATGSCTKGSDFPKLGIISDSEREEPSLWQMVAAHMKQRSPGPFAFWWDGMGWDGFFPLLPWPAFTLETCPSLPLLKRKCPGHHKWVWCMGVVSSLSKLKMDQHVLYFCTPPSFLLPSPWVTFVTDVNQRQP